VRFSSFDTLLGSRIHLLLDVVFGVIRHFHIFTNRPGLPWSGLPNVGNERQIFSLYNVYSPPFSSATAKRVSAPSVHIICLGTLLCPVS